MQARREAGKKEDEGMKECTRCPLNGKMSSECLSCDGAETYSYRYRQYIAEGYDPPSRDTSGSAPCTRLGEDDEDRLRVAMSNLFSLSPLELLCLQAIMQRKTLEEFAKQTTRFFQKHYGQMMKNKCGRFTRFHAFQLRKSILRKFP